MSLDMYLNKQTYVGGSKELKITGTKSRLQIPRVKTVTEEVAVWRKANAIHRWFVDNVQGGKDDSQQYDVSREQLKVLLDLCRQVLKEPKKAPELLPTQSGFLFGSTDYDERYFQSLAYTAEALAAELKIDKDNLQWYEYQSDW